MTTTLASLDAATRREVAHRTEMLFREAGALREGHFLLKSARHADRYVEKFQVLQFPAAVSELCGYIAARVRGPEGERLVDVVAGPTTGGVILAFEVARQLGVRGIFAEEITGADGLTRREFRRGFQIRPRERVLLVDDIRTTGGSLAATVRPVESAAGELVLAHVLVDRSGGSSELVSPESARRYPLESLWTLDLPSYEAGATCPGCAAGMTLQTPGASGAASA